MTEITEEATSRWIDANGMRVHYHEIGEGEPLIMLHSVGPGAFTSWITFCKNFPALSQRYRCIAMDLPNFAKKGIPALTSLGNAAQTAGPKLAASDGMLTDLAATANSSVPVGQNFSALLSTFEKKIGRAHV